MWENDNNLKDLLKVTTNALQNGIYKHSYYHLGYNKNTTNKCLIFANKNVVHELKLDKVTKHSFNK